MRRKIGAKLSMTNFQSFVTTVRWFDIGTRTMVWGGMMPLSLNGEISYLLMNGEVGVAVATLADVIELEVAVYPLVGFWKR